MKPTILILLLSLTMTIPGWSQICNDSNFACYPSANNYDPSSAPGNGVGAGSYSRPTCNGQAITSQETTSLQHAYSLAPPYFQTQLCRFTHVFIVQPSVGNWNSWGFWEGPDRSPASMMFIAISQGAVGANAIGSLWAEENAMVQAYVTTVGGSAQQSTYNSVSAANPDWSTLAVLAHEVGHVLLSDSNADSHPDRHDAKGNTQRPPDNCFEESFLTNPWDSAKYHKTRKRWTAFADPNGNNPKIQGFDPTNPSPTALDIVLSNNFISLIAAINPVEDVVETYKYKVLNDSNSANPPVMSVMNQKTGATVSTNVFGLLTSSSIISSKVSCLKKLRFWQ